MRKAFAFFMMLPIGCAAFATNWAAMGTDDRGVTAYMDRDSIVKDDKARYYAIKFARPEPDDHGMTYTVMKEKIDCKQRTIQTLAITAYRADDSIIGSLDRAQPVRAIALQSNAAKMADSLCNM